MRVIILKISKIKGERRNQKGRTHKEWQECYTSRKRWKLKIKVKKGEGQCCNKI